MKERVFRRSCYRVSSSCTSLPKPKGSGIGLAMTYRILQLHGGAMEVRSNADVSSPERGTTFTFRLPIAAGAGGEVTEGSRGWSGS